MAEQRSASGVTRPGKTAEEYGADLLENLETLLEEAKSGKYKAPPVRRVEIPKPGSKEKRTLGIPTCGDNVQKAIKWLIELGRIGEQRSV